MPELRNAINVYRCNACQRTTTTINLDEGVTPMFLRCRNRSCLGTAVSQMYQVPQDLKPTHEWYKPSSKELKELDIPSQFHVKHGGLLIRERDAGQD